MEKWVITKEREKLTKKRALAENMNEKYTNKEKELDRVYKKQQTRTRKQDRTSDEYEQESIN